MKRTAELVKAAAIAYQTIPYHININYYKPSSDQ